MPFVLVAPIDLSWDLSLQPQYLPVSVEFFFPFILVVVGAEI